MMRGLLPALAMAVTAGAMAGAAAAAPKPQRIVSLNLCADQLLVELVEPQRILALTEGAADPTVSAIAARAGAFRRVRGHAEEVIALEPDLVIAGAFTTPLTVSLLARLGFRVETMPIVTSLAGLKDVIGELARHVGEPERGAGLVRKLERRLAGPAPGAASPLAPATALAYQVSAIASTRPSYVDSLLTAAGLANATPRFSATRYGRIELEQIAAAPPDLLILAMGPELYRTTLADNLRHPALGRIMADGTIAPLEMARWICPTPGAGDTVAELQRLGERLARRRQ